MKHQRRHRRRDALGEPGQWDSWVHAWPEAGTAGKQVRIANRDDATSRVMVAPFVERDNGAEPGRCGPPDPASARGAWIRRPPA